MKSKENYIYPFESFKTTKLGDANADFVSTQASQAQIVKVVKKVSNLQIQPEKENLVDQIWSILTSEELLIEPREIILENAVFWKERITFFTSRNMPVSFNIMSFAYKMPNIFKTKRVLPDLGELIMLQRLDNLCKEVQKVYDPGATVAVITESIMGLYNSYSRQQMDTYEKSIRDWSNILELRNITFFSLWDIQEFLNTEIKNAIEKGHEEVKIEVVVNQEMFEKSQQIKNIMISSVSNIDFNGDENALLRIYRKEPESKTERDFRQILEKRAEEYTYNYMAILALKDEIGFTERIAPDSIPLTVSSKSTKIAVQLINKNCSKLPYHAVPIISDNEVNLEYLVDVISQRATYRQVFLQDDLDSEPFYFEKIPAKSS